MVNLIALFFVLYAYGLRHREVLGGEIGAVFDAIQKHPFHQKKHGFVLSKKKIVRFGTFLRGKIKFV